jgi:cobalt-zinc-cadmium efflux system protein
VLLSLFGLAANTISAWLLRAPARSLASFRAALAHELVDGMITLVALAGALAISLYHWRWIDPLLTLAIGSWLTAWTGRWLIRRASGGPGVWEIDGSLGH